MAVCEPGDTIMGLKLSGGGHLTHGHPNITFSGKFFKSVQFDVNAEGLIDYDEVAKLAQAEKPKLIIVGTTAYPRILDWRRLAEIANESGSYLLADISHIAGLIVGGVHPSPVEYVDVIMTTTHKTLRGPRGAMLMVTQKGLAKDPDLAKKIDRAVFPGLQGGPHNNTTAAIAVALQEASTSEFKKYSEQIVKNAKALAEELTKLGFNLTTGGTDNHLMVIDLTSKNISGKDFAIKLEENGIIVNYNAIPHDPNPPGNPSGIRIGTPALTTRGMQVPEMKLIAQLMLDTLENKNVLVGVQQLCQKFPLPA